MALQAVVLQDHCNSQYFSYAWLYGCIVPPPIPSLSCTVSLHTPVHISICLLHGWGQETSGESLLASYSLCSLLCCPLLLQFEYQQAQLEVEIENLSWKVERAETTDVAELRQQMNAAEVKRLTLLRDFIKT